MPTLWVRRWTEKRLRVPLSLGGLMIWIAVALGIIAVILICYALTRLNY